MKTKRLFAMLLSLVIAISVVFSINISAFADDVTWTFDEKQLVLTIKGTGAMTDYDQNNMDSRPWFAYASAAQEVIIEEGITHIGAYAFSRFDELAEVQIPSTVTSIGETAFGGNDKLKSITVPSTVKTIGDYAFGFDYQMQVTSDFVTYCETGSAAQRFCVAKYVPFETPMVDGVGTAYISAPAGQSMWSYVPKLDGEIVFYSVGDKDTTGLIYEAKSYVYNDVFKTMKESAVAFNDDNGNDVNFKITYSVTAGTKYYLAAKFMLNNRYDGSPLSENGRFDVRMTFNCTEHQYEIVDQMPSNCVDAGYEIYECIGCGDTYTQNLEIAPHTPNEAVQENVVASSCTEGGSYDEVVYCLECGEQISSNHITTDALDHSFTDYKSNGDATCTNDGTKTAKCDRCDETSTIKDVGTALGHNYGTTVVPATCTERGYTLHSCTRCTDSYTDTYVEPLGHSFTNYKSNGDATCTEDGTKTAKCDRCDATHTLKDVGTALGHDFALFAFDGKVVTYKCTRDTEVLTFTFNDYYNTKTTEMSQLLDINNDGFINAKDFAKIRNDLKKAQQ